LDLFYLIHFLSSFLKLINFFPKGLRPLWKVGFNFQFPLNWGPGVQNFLSHYFIGQLPLGFPQTQEPFILGIKGFGPPNSILGGEPSLGGLLGLTRPWAFWKPFLR